MATLTKAPAPYGLKILDSCLGCVSREDRLFCRLPTEVLSELNGLRQTSLYPSGAVLFVEGETPRGLYILCGGQAKLSANSVDGKSVILRLAETGEVLGLSSVMSHTPYPATAALLAPSQVSFVPRKDFLRFLQKHAEVSLRVAEHLSMELHKAWEQTRMVALAPNSRAKLAQLLLGRASHLGRETPDGVSVPLNMTQEEIGETIGASRETVSRLLAEFRRSRLIRVKGGSVLLLRPEELRDLTSK